MTRSVNLAAIGAAAVVFLGLALVAMHAIQPSLDPATHYVSEYAYGQFGWLVMVAYVAAGAGVLGVAWSAGSVLSGTRSLALAICLALVGVGLIATGVTRIDLPAADGSVASTASGMAHELAGYVLFLGLIPGAFLVAATFRRDPRLSSAALPAWIFAGSIVITFIVAVMSLSLDLIGVGQRIFLATWIAWLVFVALQLSSAERPHPESISQGPTDRWPRQHPAWPTSWPGMCCSSACSRGRFSWLQPSVAIRGCRGRPSRHGSSRGPSSSPSLSR